MAWLKDVWDAVKSFLFEGSVVRMVIICHQDAHSDVLDVAQDLRKGFNVPVSVKNADTISIDGLKVDLEHDDLFLVTEMTSSLLRGPYMSFSQLKLVDADSAVLS